MKKNFISFISALTLILSSHASEDESFNKSGAFPSLSVGNYCAETLCNTAARLYYATSVTGYGSYVEPASEFYKHHFLAQKWELNSFDFQVTDKSDIERSLKYIYKMAGLNPDFIERKTEKSSRSEKIKFSYVSQKDDVSINIIPLSAECLTTDKLHGEWIEWKLSHNEDVFSTEHPYVMHFMKNILETFPNKQIIIHTLLHSSENIPNTWLSFAYWEAMFSGNAEGVIGHYCYAKISVNQNNFMVQVTNPLLERFAPNSSLDKSKKLFEGIAENLNLTLTHQYLYKGNQFLNQHDCGRFSTIYLLNSLNGINPSDLTPIEVYRGFKQLETEGYERHHQNHFFIAPPYHLHQSRFSKLCGLRRVPAGWFLTWMGK